MTIISFDLCLRYTCMDYSACLKTPKNNIEGIRVLRALIVPYIFNVEKFVRSIYAYLLYLAPTRDISNYYFSLYDLVIISRLNAMATTIHRSSCTITYIHIYVCVVM
jgi:hypothetical protein